MNRSVRYVPLILILLCMVLLAACGKKTPATTISTTSSLPRITLTSSVFNDNGSIPVKYTCAGENISPPLAWENVPAGTKSLVLIVDDLNAKLYTHWVLFNIPPSAKGLAAAIPANGTLTDGSLQGFNSAKTLGYAGPCPPTGELHRYRFRLYALDTMMNLPEGTSKSLLVEKMTGHIVKVEGIEAVAELTGIYQH